MRTRGILSIAIIAILLGSLIPISNDIELDDVEMKHCKTYSMITDYMTKILQSKRFEFNIGYGETLLTLWKGIRQLWGE